MTVTQHSICGLHPDPERDDEGVLIRCGLLPAHLDDHYDEHLHVRWGNYLDQHNADDPGGDE